MHIIKWSPFIKLNKYLIYFACSVALKKKKQEESVLLEMRKKYIHLWSLSSGDLGTVEPPFCYYYSQHHPDSEF